MDPPMWAPFSNNRFGGDFQMHPSGPPVTQSAVPYGGSGIQPMMPVENFNSPYMMSPYDNIMNKSSVVSDMNGSQQELPKSGMDLHPPVSNMSSSSAPLWSPMVSSGALNNSDMPPKTAYSDLQFPGQMNRMSPIPSAAYQQNTNSQQITGSPAPQSPMLQRSQTPTHATDLRLDTNNRIAPRAYPASQSPNAASPPENYNHSNSMATPYSPYPSAAPSPHVQSVPFTQQPPTAPQCFSSNATAGMKSPPDSNSNPKITYPSVITHASSAHSTEDAQGHGEDLPNIDAQFLNESLNDKEGDKSARRNSNESKEAGSDNEAASEEAGDASNSEESDNEGAVSPNRSLNPNDPSLQPVVKLNSLPTDTLKELEEPSIEEHSEPDHDAQPALLMNHFLDQVSKVHFLDMADEELGDLKSWDDAPVSRSAVKFSKKDTGFMKSFLRFLKGEQEPSLVTPGRSYIRRYEPNLPIKRAAVASTESTKEDKPADPKPSEPSASATVNISRPANRGRGRGRGGFVQMSRKRDMDSDEENRPPHKVAREEPRRSSRRLRTKSNVSYRSMEYNSETEEEEYEVDDPIPATGGDDSDSDPAWSPVIAREQDEDDDRIVESPPPPPPSARGRRRGRPAGGSSNRMVVKKKTEEVSSRTSENEEDSQSSQPSQGEKNPFTQGDFVVVKSEMGESEHPPIWRVDSKSLLQKYSAEKKDGKWLYSNISTYAGYTPQTVANYVKINVKIHNFSRNEAVVEWLRDEKAEADEDGEGDVTVIPPEDASSSETNSYQESFEIYIQTLISQALDVNFLTEIYQERDDYFVSNMEKIDKYTEKKKELFVELLEWKNEDFLKSMGGWPMVNVVKKTNPSEATQCQACEKQISTKLVLLYGQTYDSLTLAHCQADDFLANNKNWNLCEECTNSTDLYNKLVHQKYKYYIKCASRVANKRQDNPAKDTTDILNELLADDPWLNTLFKEARTVWSQVDAIEKNKAKD